MEKLSIVSLIRKPALAEINARVIREFKEKENVSVEVLYSSKNRIKCLDDLGGVFFEQEPIKDVMASNNEEHNLNCLKQSKHIVGLYNSIIPLSVGNMVVILEEGMYAEDLIGRLYSASYGMGQHYSCISSVYPSRTNKLFNHISLTHYSLTMDSIPNELIPNCLFPVAWAGAAASIWNGPDLRKKILPFEIKGVRSPIDGLTEVPFWENFVSKRFIELGMLWAVDGRIKCSHAS